MKSFFLGSLLLAAGVSLLSGCDRPERQVIPLNGTWDIAVTPRGKLLPENYGSRCPVPGLVDMSEPALVPPRTQTKDSVFWYRTTIEPDDGNYDVANLRIGRSRYYTRVYVNGHPAGRSPYNLTASEYDLKPFLRPDRKNELAIAVGCFNNVSDSVVDGRDAEIYFYPPGLYDDVTLTLSDYPYIANLQTAPDIERGTLRVIARVVTDPDGVPGTLRYRVREVATGKTVARGDTEDIYPTEENGEWQVDFTVPIKNFRLWSPEDPFLYELTVSSTGDTESARFGMRTFRFDTPSGMAVLNGKPYYLRGTNVDLNRFYEDDLRDSLPWSRDWTTRLHRGIKDNYMNAIRYTTCFPPGFWYDLCDSLGILVFDEYDIWGMVDSTETLTQTADQLAREYAIWMRERWNHPSVVVWDAQNETLTSRTGEAIGRVRHLDIQNRPWDNGFAPPVAETDCKEVHPYIFMEFLDPSVGPPPEGILKYAYGRERIPENGPDQWSPDPSGRRYPNATIVNEYGWLWLNRDGSPTTLSGPVYAKLFGDSLSAAELREIYGRHLGMLTEYWRESRRNAGVLHFSTLTFSRNTEAPRSCTGDNFTDIRALTYDSCFLRYVRPAFCPVGVMVKYFESELAAGETITVPISVINDTYESYGDTLRLYFRPEATGEALPAVAGALRVEENGKQSLSLPIRTPSEAGRYELVAEILFEGEPIRSVRRITVR